MKQNKNLKCLKLIMVIVCSFNHLYVYAGNNKLKELQKYVAQHKMQAVSSIDPVSIEQALEPFEYTSKNLTNPFEPPVVAQTMDKTNQPDLQRLKEPLENFPLDSLNLSGILSRDDCSWAIINTPNNNVYRVQVGNYIGQDFGKVISVDENSIVIEENVANLDGKWLQHYVKLKL